MAVFGAKYPCFAKMLTEPNNALPTYDTGIALGKLVTAALTVNLASGEYHADNEQVEELSEFINGSLQLDTDDMLDSIDALIQGATMEGDMVGYDADDTPPWGGLGYYKTLLRNGVKYFKAFFYPKVKASLGNDTATTKGSSITFSGKSTPFVIKKPAFGKWLYTETFASESAAKAWIDTKLSVAEWHLVNIAKSGEGTVAPLGKRYVADAGSLDIAILGEPSAIYDNGEDITTSLTGGKITLSNVTEEHSVVVIYESVASESA